MSPYPIYACTHLVYLHMPYSTQCSPSKLFPSSRFLVCLGPDPEQPDHFRVSRISSEQAGPFPAQPDIVRTVRTKSDPVGFRPEIPDHIRRLLEPPI